MPTVTADKFNSTSSAGFNNTLAGLTVVALEQAVAAPYCTARLADAGARVIKIERPEGDFARGYDTAAAGASAYFVWLNRGKESVCLDLRLAEDAALLECMLGQADVFVQNLAPGAAGRLGFGSERLRGDYPQLITLDISGYGEAPEVAQLKAYDLLVQCEAGLASITGSPDQPGRVGVSVCDIACGMYAHTAVLQALLARSSTGQAAGLSVSLFDAIADWMAVPLVQFEGGLESKRVGLNHPTIAPYGAYKCADEELLVFSIQNQREWQRLCEQVLERPQLAVDERFSDNTKRLANREALDRTLNQTFARLSRPELAQRFAKAGLAYGAVNDLAGLQQHPALRRQPQQVAGSEVAMVSPPVRVAGEALAPFGSVPAAGEHTAAVREEFS